MCCVRLCRSSPPRSGFSLRRCRHFVIIPLSPAIVSRFKRPSGLTFVNRSLQPWLCAWNISLLRGFPETFVPVPVRFEISFSRVSGFLFLVFAPQRQVVSLKDVWIARTYRRYPARESRAYFSPSAPKIRNTRGVRFLMMKHIVDARSREHLQRSWKPAITKLIDSPSPRSLAWIFLRFNLTRCVNVDQAGEVRIRYSYLRLEYCRTIVFISTFGW